MKYLLDTNHWSFIQRRDPVVLARIAKLPPDVTLLMSVVTQAELLAGVELLHDNRRRTELRDLYHSAVGQAAEIVLIDSAVAIRFATVFAQLKRTGKPIPTNDLWMAAIAMANDLTLVTRDIHFHSIEGLRAEDWTLP